MRGASRRSSLKASCGGPAAKRSGFERSISDSLMHASSTAARHAEKLGDRGLQKSTLASDRGGAPRILLDDHLEQRRVGEVAEDQMVEAGGELRQGRRLPGSDGGLQQAKAGGVHGTGQAPGGGEWGG